MQDIKRLVFFVSEVGVDTAETESRQVVRLGFNNFDVDTAENVPRKSRILVVHY